MYVHTLHAYIVTIKQLVNPVAGYVGITVTRRNEDSSRSFTAFRPQLTDRIESMRSTHSSPRYSPVTASPFVPSAYNPSGFAFHPPSMIPTHPSPSLYFSQLFYADITITITSIFQYCRVLNRINAYIPPIEPPSIISESWHFDSFCRKQQYRSISRTDGTLLYQKTDWKPTKKTNQCSIGVIAEEFNECLFRWDYYPVSGSYVRTICQISQWISQMSWSALQK